MVSHCRAHSHIHTHMNDQIENKPIKMKTAFVIVVAIHFAAILGFALLPSIAKARELSRDKNFVDPKMPEYVGITDNQTKEVLPTPTPTPVPVATPIPIASPTPVPIATPEESFPKAKLKEVATPQIQTNPKLNSRYTKEYKVRRGDTIYSISKRFKLDINKLIKLNNIKNPNNIKEGQVLKFM